jgi:putative acetyltransferase
MVGAMEIRHATSDERPQVETVVLAAFEEEPDGRLSHLLRALDTTGATRASLVAVDRGRIVGHVQLSRSWVDARSALVDVLVLSPLSVAPDRQGEGIGTALIRAAIDDAERRGAPAVFLEGSPDYYGRRGFEAATPLGFLRPSPRIPDPGFQVALLARYEPWMVGPLVYCEAFWSTDCVGLRGPDLARIEQAARSHP